MEKVIHITNNNLNELNKLLEEGWTVKLISAYGGSEYSTSVGAYVVIVF